MYDFLLKIQNQNKMKTNKAGTFMNIPVKVLKQALAIISEPLMKIWNEW